MDYSEAMALLEEAGSRRGIRLGLARMRRLMSLLGDPQDQVGMIHIAGTNGKGSVAAWLESILIAAGIRTGAYSSPAVFHPLEGIRTGGLPVSEERFARLFEKVCQAAEKMESDYGEPTRFELETACAFCYFEEEGCETAVLETGLGGDEDATNVCGRVLLSVITSVSMDHAGILGNTLPEIARHKAGIIKRGVPCVSSPQVPEVRAVLRECRELAEREEGFPPDGPVPGKTSDAAGKADPGITSDTAEETNPAGKGILFADSSVLKVISRDVSGTAVQSPEFGRLHTSQCALWQTENLQTVLTAVSVLKSRGLAISDEAVRSGVEAMRWPGRFEILQSRPWLIADGAHNPQGILGFRDSLNELFPDAPIALVMGVFADKDYHSMIRLLLTGEKGIGKRLVFAGAIAPDSPRALSADALRDELCAVSGISAEVYSSPSEAVRYAGKAVPAGGCIAVCGSLSFLKEIYQPGSRGKE